MIRRLVREEYLETIERHRDGRKGPEPVFRRGDVEDLLRVVPGLKEKWESARAHKLKKSEKRRPLRNQEEKTSFSREQKPIVLDSFQCEAIDALDKDNSVLVAAPTGTGKTVIAEKIVEKVLSEGRDIIYTSPIKALSNQKFRDFTHRFGRNKVGLITGDISIYERSPLLVMTTEIFRNWCFSNPEWMSNISFVIFDEIHYLDDPHRGTAWEESIIFAPPHIKILGLSATVPNIHELADWMSDVRQYPVVVVEEKERAVPLVIKYAASSGEILNEREAREEIEFFMEENEKGVKKKSVK
ncbi:MAG: DEAD/DEAH box helicase [Clostridiales bacterium]|nr:DEAD/DEAH box helicase [Clostridiales bacterium]MCF8022423.1 DEAD/DEAH box helicase [Clostridiales bacterium]